MDTNTVANGVAGEDRFSWNLLCACGHTTHANDRLSRGLIVTAWYCSACCRWNTGNFKDRDEGLKMHDRLIEIAVSDRRWADVTIPIFRGSRK